MHSNKIAFTFIMGMMVTTAWAEPTAEVKPTTTTQATTSSETQPEVRVEDIDAPILE